MKLFEVLDRPVEWKYEDVPPGQVTKLAVFEIEGNVYKVIFIRNFYMFDGSGFWVRFINETAGEGKEQYGILNTGNAFKVFATVKDIIKDFVKNEKPDVLAFTAKEPSRMKLYDRLIPFFKQLGFNEIHSYIEDGLKTYMFAINEYYYINFISD